MASLTIIEASHYNIMYSTDINECLANTNNCAQTCSNTVGSFTCGCNSGFTLDSNAQTCSGEIYASLSWEK